MPSTPRSESKRARPLLGTLVAIRCRGLSLDEANPQMERAFDAVATVHGLMSFHEAGSDVARLNGCAPGEVVEVDAHTYAVLEAAQALAEASDGLFDITIADQLVAWGRLPRPAGEAPDGAATWRDIELIAPGEVRLRRRLWLDLGGIAKGYAVDRAIAQLSARDGVSWCVNAGGDLRTIGEEAEQVLLQTETQGDETVPVLEIENAAIASSCGRETAEGETRLPGGAHIHPARRAPTGRRSFVSVVAQDCIVADALTKVVLADAAKADDVLRSYNATAFLHGSDGGWTTLGGAAA